MPFLLFSNWLETGALGEGAATDDSVPLTFPGGEAGLEAGAAPGVWLLSGWEQMAPDPRVPAAAAAPRECPVSVRRGGWTRRAQGESFLPRPVVSFCLGMELYPTGSFQGHGGLGRGKLKFCPP